MRIIVTHKVNNEQNTKYPCFSFAQKCVAFGEKTYIELNRQNWTLFVGIRTARES